MKKVTQLQEIAIGQVQVSVVENGKVVKTYPWQRNLILNQGLDMVCSTREWANAMTHCCAGSGTTDTNSASGAGNTGSGASTTFTGPGGFNFTTNSSIGDMIRMTSGASSGTEVRITSVTGATSVEYTPSGSISAGEFSVYRTSQTGLTTELKRTTAWLTGAGNCGTTVVSNAVTLKRTFDFTAEVGSVTYNEIGISYTATVSNNLFSRIKLAVGVPLVTGRQLRVAYQLTITVSPATLAPKTFGITGWPISPSTSLDGDEQWQSFGLRGVDTNGNSSTAVFTDGPRDCMEPSVGSLSSSIWISPSSTAPTTFNTAPVNRSTNATFGSSTLSTYVSLNFFRDKSYTFLVGEANRTDFRSMGVGHRDGSAIIHPANTGTGFVCVFDEAQTKDAVHTLLLTFRFNVGRTLA